MSRPSLYTQETADAICERLANGESLRRICGDAEMPAYSTVRKWQAENEAFSAQSARAKEWGCDALADEALEIADRKEDDPQDRRIRIDTRIRLIGKWHQRRYGDKAQVDHTSSDGSMTPPTMIQLVGPSGNGTSSAPAETD